MSVSIPSNLGLGTPSHMGWQCPCCRVVYAPSVTTCRCATMQSNAAAEVGSWVAGVGWASKMPPGSRVIDPVSGRDLGPAD